MMTPKVRIAWLIGKRNRTIIILSLYRSIMKNKRKVNIDDKAQQLGISGTEIFIDIFCEQFKWILMTLLIAELNVPDSIMNRMLIKW